jgi:hypothetical protein
MKKKIFNWMYGLAIKVIAINIVRYGNKLTPEYLLQKGWIEKDGYYVESNIKDRDLISISFEADYCRVWHGANKTFIALEATIEWFENYYCITHNNGLYDIAGI